jgi:hypothetical protein
VCVPVCTCVYLCVPVCVCVPVCTCVYLCVCVFRVKKFENVPCKCEILEPGLSGWQADDATSNFQLFEQ